eukprot:Pgem_evm1s10040
MTSPPPVITCPSSGLDLTANTACCSDTSQLQATIYDNCGGAYDPVGPTQSSVCGRG